MLYIVVQVNGSIRYINRVLEAYVYVEHPMVAVTIGFTAHILQCYVV